MISSSTAGTLEDDYNLAGGDARAMEIVHRMLGGSSVPPLVAPTADSFQLRSCMNCGATSNILTCGGCRAVGLCSVECQQGDEFKLTHDLHGCSRWKAWGERNMDVTLPSNPTWLNACMHHGGKDGCTRCSILTSLGIHSGLYLQCACACGADGLVAAGYEDGSNIALLRQMGGSTCVIAPKEHSEGEFIFQGHPGEISSWAEYYAFRKLSPESPLALLMHFPLTLYHILVKLQLVGPPSLGRLRRAEPLRIHYLGVEGKEWALKDFYRELAILLPHDTLEIDMVGPGIDGPAPGHVDVISGRLGGRVTVRFHRKVYNDAVQRTLGGAPHVAVALNAGLATPRYKWQTALRTLAEHRTPFAFTDYTEYGIYAGTTLLDALGMPITMPSAPNPFCQPLRWPDASNACFTMPWISNGFLCACNTNTSSAAPHAPPAPLPTPPPSSLDTSLARGLHPGVFCRLMGLQSEPALNNEPARITAVADAAERQSLSSKARFRVVLLDPRHGQRVLSVKATCLQRRSSTVDECLEAAVRADVRTGEMPMPMSVASLRSALAYGSERQAKWWARLRCHRCGRQDEEGEPYCALQVRRGNGEILLECTSCLVLAAAEEELSLDRVTAFIDERYMGSVQACSLLQLC